MIFPEFVPQEVIDKTYGPSREQIALQNSRKATTPNTNFNNSWDLGIFGKLKGLLGKGPTCTNTATGCYYPNRSTAGSRNLLDNPLKAGFQIINLKQVVPGSIIVISNPDNTKRHSVIFDRVHLGKSYLYSDPNDKNTYLVEPGDTLVNYSNGGHKSKNYRRGVPLNKAFPKRTKHIYLKAFLNGGNMTTETDFNSPFNKLKRKYNRFKSSITDNINDIQQIIGMIDSPKDVIYRIMTTPYGKTYGTNKSIENIKIALQNKDLWLPRNKVPRNLASLYLYGNDLKLFEEAPELKLLGVEYDNYLKSIGRDPDTIKTYKGNIPSRTVLPESIKFNLPEYIKSSKNKTWGAEQNLELESDNVAGFLQRLSLDTNLNPVVINSDLWDFEPNSYSKRYGDNTNNWKLWLKAKALDIAGTPFILKDVSPITYVNIDQFYDEYEHLSDLSKGVARDFGYLPEVIVTSSNKLSK